jgi:hypothetical protein
MRLAVPQRGPAFTISPGGTAILSLIVPQSGNLGKVHMIKARSP